MLTPLSLLLSFSLLSAAEVGTSQWLLRQLNDDRGWELQEELPDGRRYFEKIIPGLDLVAVETAQKIDFEAKDILKKKSKIYIKVWWVCNKNRECSLTKGCNSTEFWKGSW